jgi:ABC-type multidrug transport system fused ATPase/permease subunit
MKKVIDWLKDNDLSLSMFSLFIVFLVGDSISGLHSYNSQQASQGFAQLGYWQYIGIGAFLDGVFVNWQAAILQLTVLIVFSEFLTQRGASHSRKPAEEKQRKTGRRNGDRSERRVSGRETRSQRQSRDRPEAKRHTRQERKWWQTTWLYRNSLSLAFILLFVIAFSLHALYGHLAFNTKRALLHQPPVDLGSYLISSKLWSDTFQCWQAEFFVMWFFLIASIYLRQEYSAESKPLGADVGDTGEPNE